jgi:low temperature requirement protein LtrA
VAAADNTAMRHETYVVWIPVLGASALLLTGALLGGVMQTLLFAAAVLVDWGGIYLIARNGHWQISSAAHWNERHSLFVILAIGESLVSIGVGAAAEPISTPLLIAAVLGVAVSVALWRIYFDILSPAAEHNLVEARGKARLRMALEAYSSGHFPIIAGIILIALGLEGVLAHPHETKPLGFFYALPLFGGAAVYLAGQLLFKNRLRSHLSRPRLIATVLLAAVAPLAARIPPLAALTVLIVVLGALIAIETVHYAPIRQELHEG